MGFSRGENASQVRIERAVSTAARQFSASIQELVQTAQESQQDDWKEKLLVVLGEKKKNAAGTDLDTLLTSRCDTFGMRCVEHEVAPNLVHCLRLLRVLEMHSDSTEPVSARATRRVGRLLCRLVSKDASTVMPQLHVHLLGLFSLVGAVYPVRGLAVSKAAADVVLSMAEYVPVQLLHQRKMIIIMMNDLKELCGMEATEAEGMTGAEAEAQSTWTIQTIVKLVIQDSELVRDFEKVDGYAVVSYMIEHATKAHGKDLLEVVPQLACCSGAIMMEEEDQGRLAVNGPVLDILQDLLQRSNPLLIAYAKAHNGALPDFGGNLPALAQFSIQTGITMTADEPAFGFDVPSEILSTALALFSNDPRNFERVEGTHHVLSSYLFALPCFQDPEIKTFTLKTLEFVLTGVGVDSEVTPINAVVEIFFALCSTLIRGADKLKCADKGTSFQKLSDDTKLMGDTLEKLLQFDQRVAPLMVESGIMTTNLDALLDLISTCTTTPEYPPLTSSLDQPFSSVCGVLQLLVAHQPITFHKETDEITETCNLHRLLRLSITELGVDSAKAASGVFEAYMASFASLDGLNNDMRFVMMLVDKMSEILSSLEGSNEQRISLLSREASLISMMRSVLEARSLARGSFRSCSGFDMMLRTLASWKGSIDDSSETVFKKGMQSLVQASLGVIEAAVGIKSKNPIATDELSHLVLPPGVIVDPFSSRASVPSPAVENRNFLRTQRYYLRIAEVVTQIGILEACPDDMIAMALGQVDPVLTAAGTKKVDQLVRNPDALRLLLGLVVRLPEASRELASQSLEKILLIVHSSNSGVVSQVASCGLCSSLTSPLELGAVIGNTEHPFFEQFYEVLTILSAHKMSFTDFTNLLRCMAGPLLSVGSTVDGRVRLPVMSSSIKKRSASSLMSSDSWIKEFVAKENDLYQKLQCVCDIAKSTDRTARIRVGGDSINSVAVLMHQVPLADRLKSVSEEGRLKYLEVEKLNGSVSDSKATGSAEQVEKVWSPMTTTGFTYSTWMRHELDGDSPGTIYVLDMASPFAPGSNDSAESAVFLSLWYDVQNQRFNIMSSASNRGETICFPVSPLRSHVWHHIMLTYAPAKRTMMSRKSVVSLYVDGRPLEAEVKVDAVNLPPNSRVVIGAPNAALAISGIVRGAIANWELGPCLLLSAVLLDFDATALYSYGPRYPGLLWGGRPQRLSLAATATASFAMLSNTGEPGSLASALRRRDIVKLERAGYSTMGHGKKDDLSSMSLMCMIPPENVIFGFQPSSSVCRTRHVSRRLVMEKLLNTAHLKFAGDAVSSDGVVFGRETMITPFGFADNLQFAGGPDVLIPLVNAANSSRLLALVLELIREGCRHQRPNLEMLQAGGGYRVLGVLLQEKPALDQECMDQCLAFAIHGFVPNENTKTHEEPSSLRWVLSDLDAMKHLLLNHKVWDLKKYGPEVPLRLLWALNRLVGHRALHKAFNARRLHQVGIVRWTLHLMIEACELYMQAETADSRAARRGESWECEPPLVTDVVVGGDPGNAFLLECKNLLRRVLTFMLTPGDLAALAEISIYTVAISSHDQDQEASSEANIDDRMLPSSTMRLHLVRLLEELIVDGVNEIVATPPAAKNDPNSTRDNVIFQPHSGGVASPGQPYFASSVNRGVMNDGSMHPKHQQAQAFLSAFSGFLTPVWFATLLEGTREEASAAATLRLMILLLQGSAAFEDNFVKAGGFAPFVLSLPKYSTSPGLAIAMLSQLLNVPILHLHALPRLDPEQLCELFDAEGDVVDRIPEDKGSDPSAGVFALLSECIGRNINIIASDAPLKERATDTNQAIFKLLCHRFDVSTPFREYCKTKSILVPLSQTLCSVIDDNRLPPRRRRSSLVDVPKNITPTERFIGGPNEADSGGMGIVRILRRILSGCIKDSPNAAAAVRAIFHAFPIHTSVQQCNAFHLIVHEHCCTSIDKIMEEGGSIAVTNCVGVCSVFLDLMVNGFFSSEAAVNSFRAITSILIKLVKYETSAVHALSTAEHSFLTMDAAHIAVLCAGTALRISVAGVRAGDTFDMGDEDLQSEVLQMLDSNIEYYLLVASKDRRKSRRIPNGSFPRPAQGNRLFPLWQAASVFRLVPGLTMSYPDLCVCEDAAIASLAPLIVSLKRALSADGDTIRNSSVSVLLSLLRHRLDLMKMLLVANIQRGEESEKIDIISRGGFFALLTADEANKANRRSGTYEIDYDSFFEWYNRDNSDIQIVFDAIQTTAFALFPEMPKAYSLQADVVEEEQKKMLLRLTTEDSDRTIIGGLERSDLCRRCNERTSESHFRWKRQGFDDLAYGAMKLKTLMRMLKGSFSIWEGGNESLDPASSDDIRQSVRTLESSVERWKLDLSEGFERQRRRLLPNYEFHGLYNLDENAEIEEILDTPEESHSNGDIGDTSDVVEVEATAALLKEMNLKRTHKQDSEFDNFEDDYDDENMTTGTSTTAISSNDGTEEKDDSRDDTKLHTDAPDVSESANETDMGGKEDSYELVTGLLQKGDWPLKSYNVRRCTGLEVTKALFLCCQDALYVIDGFEQTDGDKITRVEREQSTYHINLRPKGFTVGEEEDVTDSTEDRGSSPSKPNRKRISRATTQDLASEVLHQHRSQRIELGELHAVYRRRYQLQQNGLEFFDVHKNATLIAFDDNKAREEVLSKVLSSNLHPESIFKVYGSSLSFAKTMSNLKSKITSQWINGKMSNFDFLMQLNNLAGRSFNDLTQYPVFPWVIADYDSEEIDLNDPKIYRDLSKPMGALGEDRARQFRERYEALESTYFGDDDPPPFHYGTHFSSAAYTLYYLMRLEPFSRLALTLQGGRFDVADRLFHDIGRSWKSASRENLQDVRELIPEFYFLPDFLVNTNGFDFGVTQRGKTVHDVTLPKWAKGDPKRFVRINRQALESRYVSQHLHKWVDLIFGCKQRSVADLNVFVHVTYEGEVDLESMDDPIQKASTIAQIQNFGQTPSKLDRKPFPAKNVTKLVNDRVIDLGCLPQFIKLSPPLSVLGVPSRVQFSSAVTDTFKFGLIGQADRAVGDLALFKSQSIGLGRMCSSVPKTKKYVRFGGLNNGVSFHSTARNRDVNNLVSIHDGLHRAPISIAKASNRGDWLITGCVDSTLRVWRVRNEELVYKSTLCGHDGFCVRALDVSSEFSTIASGCDQGRVLLWNLRTLCFVRELPQASEGEPVLSVSINNANGNVLTLVGGVLSLFDINGNLLATHDDFESKPTCAVATDCPEWLEHGVVAVTGHVAGDVYLWVLDYESDLLIMKHKLEGNHHNAAITALKVDGADRQDYLMVGDSSGKISQHRTLPLESLDTESLSRLMLEEKIC